jgi:predicted MFS family arabinose efflux permease
VFQQPARSSMISDAVPREYLTNAIGLNSLVFNVTRGLGPALAGALIVVAGTGGTFGVQALVLAAACAATWPLAPMTHGAHAARRASFAQSIVDGWKLSWENRTVRAGLSCVMLVSLFVIPFTTLLPVFARDLLAVGASGQGLMLTAMGAGAFFSAALVANAGHDMPRGLVMLVSGVLYGLSVMVFAASPWFALSLAAMGAAGLFHVYSNALVQTVVQSYTPPEFRGRTMALFNMHQVAITLGALLVGTLASLAGPRWALALMGAAGALSMMALHFAMPQARHIR